MLIKWNKNRFECRMRGISGAVVVVWRQGKGNVSKRRWLIQWNNFQNWEVTVNRLVWEGVYCYTCSRREEREREREKEMNSEIYSILHFPVDAFFSNFRVRTSYVKKDGDERQEKKMVWWIRYSFIRRTTFFSCLPHTIPMDEILLRIIIPCKIYHPHQQQQQR